MSGRKSVATLLVAIAEELYTFGSISESRGGWGVRRSDDQVAVHTYASPKNNPELKRPLADIRPDLAEVYAAQHGIVPAASALADAMMVLEGKARKAAPIEGDGDALAALFGGGKDNTATRLVQIAQARFRFGVTITGESYAVPVEGPNVARVLRGGRRSLRAELARIYYQETKTAANSQALADALLILEGEAQGMEPAEVALRVGRSPADGRLVLDLGADDGRAVVIGAYGWEIVEVSPVLFWRTNATLSLPLPEDVGSLTDLRDLLNISETDWPLIVAWLVAALIPDLPHPVLLLRGEHGTAKSSAARLLTSLIDRCASQLRTAPRNVEDWAVAAAGSWVTCLDNVSDLQHWLQDAICRASTGDGMLRRQLYTDSDVSVLAFRRVVALTSIDVGSINGDLADRLLTIELERIPASRRSTEEDLTHQWTKIHAEVLGGLLHVVVNVLRVLPTVQHTDLPRMADFARVLLAVDKVLGTSGFSTYSEHAGRTAETVAESDSVAIAIRERITVPWQGTASELLTKLTVDKPPKDWPSTPRGMTGRLMRVAPTLRALGWTIEQGQRTTKARPWSITPPPHSEEFPAAPSHPSHPSPPSSSVIDQGKHDDEPHGEPDDGPCVDDEPDDGSAPDVSAGHDAHDDDDGPAGSPSDPDSPNVE